MTTFILVIIASALLGAGLTALACMWAEGDFDRY